MNNGKNTLSSGLVVVPKHAYPPPRYEFYIESSWCQRFMTLYLHENDKIKRKKGWDYLNSYLSPLAKLLIIQKSLEFKFWDNRQIWDALQNVMAVFELPYRS